jgi:hypothetical protein
MIKKLSLLIATLGLSGLVSTANADLAAPVWTCTVDAEKVSGVTLAFILSVGGLETADATITCTQPGEEPVVKKAGIVITGLGAGFGFSFYKSFVMKSVIVGFSDPNDLYGDYRFGVKSGVNLFNVEGGAIATATLDNGVNVEFGLYGAKAYGLAASAQAIFLQVMTPEDYAQMLKDRQEKQNNAGSNK